jgi:pimeloyl-ACP methyl ester carboxylesterase
MSWRTVEKWPAWLAADLPDCAIWSLEHESAPTILRGKAMHLVDRAHNCLPLLLSEASLETGEIAFVAHSFGGLIIAELLRVSDGRSHAESKVANFLQRVRRIAFLGTPHLGADLASWGGRLALVSKASSVLPRNDPHLRGLNQWFRRYVDDNQIAPLTLTETQRTGLFGYIVKPDSSDLGLSTFPIPVDADHYSIVSPSDRNSEIYRHIRDFLRQAAPPAHPQATLAEAVANQTASIERLAQQSAGGLERLEKSLADRCCKATLDF